MEKIIRSYIKTFKLSISIVLYGIFFYKMDKIRKGDGRTAKAETRIFKFK